MTKHFTTWEDGMSAGYYCEQDKRKWNDKWKGVIGVRESDDDIEVCDICHAKLKLVWDVHIEEIK